MNIAKVANSMSVAEIQDEMKKLPQAECPVFHHFADGCYARELHIAKGVALVGALHKTCHHFVVSKGKIVVKNGNHNQVLKAGYHGITKSGDKRMIIGLEDSIMTTFHVTELTDPDEIGKVILGEEL